VNVRSVIGGCTYGMSRTTAARRGPGGVLVVELAEQVVDESTYRDGSPTTRPGDGPVRRDGP